MKIDHYSFGSMEINGKIYEKDLIIFPDRVLSNWWRREGHSLALEDLKEVMEYKPELLIIGTGASGVMEIPDETIKALKKQSIEVLFKNTHDAARMFNKQDRSKRIVGVFHLTC